MVHIFATLANKRLEIQIVKVQIYETSRCVQITVDSKPLENVLKATYGNHIGQKLFPLCL